MKYKGNDKLDSGSSSSPAPLFTTPTRRPNVTSSSYETPYSTPKFGKRPSYLNSPYLQHLKNTPQSPLNKHLTSDDYSILTQSSTFEETQSGSGSSDSESGTETEVLNIEGYDSIDEAVAKFSDEQQAFFGKLIFKAFNEFNVLNYPDALQDAADLNAKESIGYNDSPIKQEDFVIEIKPPKYRQIFINFANIFFKHLSPTDDLLNVLIYIARNNSLEVGASEPKSVRRSLTPELNDIANSKSDDESAFLKDTGTPITYISNTRNKCTQKHLAYTALGCFAVGITSTVLFNKFIGVDAVKSFSSSALEAISKSIIQPFTQMVSKGIEAAASFLKK